MRWLISVLVFPAVSYGSEPADVVEASLFDKVDDLVSSQFEWPYQVDKPAGYPPELGTALGPNTVESLYWSAVLAYCDHSIVYDTGCNLRVCTVSSAHMLGFSNATFFVDVAAQNAVTVYSNPTEQQVVEAYKATTAWSMVEWMKNMLVHKAKRYCEDCEIHTGNLNHYLAMKPSVLSSRSARFSTMTNPKLIVTGFSLGAAQGSLSTYEAMVEHASTNVAVQGFVFGCPRVGNDKFRALFFAIAGDNKFFRFQNWKDFIGFFPFRVMGFRSVGSEVWLNKGAEKFEFTPFSKEVVEDYETGSVNLGVWLWSDLMHAMTQHTLYFGEDQNEDLMACGGVSAMNSNINTSKPVLYDTFLSFMEET